MASSAPSVSLNPEVWRVLLFHRDPDNTPKDSSRTEGCSQRIPRLTLRRVILVWLIATAGLQVALGGQDFRLLVPLLALLLILTCKHLLALKRQQVSKIDSGLYSVWKMNEVEEKSGQSLLPGHIFYLHCGDSVPADTMILASGRADCCVLCDTSAFIGTFKIQSRSPVHEIQRVIKTTELEEALVRLNHVQGSVKVPPPSVDVDTFRGQVKLRGYPVAAKIRAENLLLKGYRIVTTSWVLGMVVYAGAECKRNLIAKGTEKRRMTKVDELLNHVYITLIAFVVITSLINSILGASVTANGYSMGQLLHVFTVLYSHGTTASVFLLIEMLRALYGYLLTVDLLDGSKLAINDSLVVDSLGRVQYALLDSSGTITLNELQCKAIYVNHLEFTACSANQNLHANVCLSLDSVRKYRDLTEMTQISVRTFDCQFALLGRLMQKESTYRQMCAAIVLCSSTMINEHDTPDFTSKADKALWNAAKGLGVTVLQKTKVYCRFRVGATEEKFTVLEVMDYKPQIQRMRVLVQSEDSEDGLLIVRGTYDALKLILDSTELEGSEIKYQYKSFVHQRFRSEVYGYKLIPRTEMAAVVATLTDAKMLGEISRKLDNFFHDLEKRCKFLGIVGLEDSISQSSFIAVDALVTSGVNTWLVSGDDEEVTVAVAQAVGLLPADAPIVWLNNIRLESNCKVEISRRVQNALFSDSLSDAQSMQDMHEDAKSQWDLYEKESTAKGSALPPLLRFIPVTNGPADIIDIRNLQGNLEYGVVLDGATFSTAMKQSGSRELLSTLLYCASYVCCYNMQPLEKMLLAKLVRDNFGNGQVTLVVGDSESDIPMLKTADISVAITNTENSFTAAQCDLAVERIAAVPELIAACKGIAQTIEIALCGVVYATMLPVGIVFWYTYGSSISGCEILSPPLWVLYTLETSTYIIIISIFPDERSPINTRSLVRAGSTWRKALSLLLITLGQSLIIWIFIYVSAQTAITPHSGHTETFSSLSIEAYISMSVAALLQLSIVGNRFSVSSSLLPTSIFGFSLFGIYWTSGHSANEIGLEYVTHAPAAVLCILGASLASLVVSYLFFSPSILHSGAINVSKVIPYSMNPGKVREFQPKVFKDSAFWLRRQGNYAYDFHPLWLAFNSRVVEEEFLSILSEESTNRVTAVLFLGLVVVYISYESAVRTFHLPRLIVYLSCGGVIAGLNFCPQKLRYTRLSLFLVITSVFVFQLVEATLDPLTFLIQVSFSFIQTPRWQWHAAASLYNCTAAVIVVWLYMGESGIEMLLHKMGATGVLLLFFFGLVVLTHYNERSRRTEFKRLKSTELGLTRSKDLFSCLFPSFVVGKVATTELPIVCEESQVTVVFIDICDFDQICSLYSPKELTQLLDDIAKKLDDLCDSNGVVKIENVGKTFLACAGITEQEEELHPDFIRMSHARRALNLALDVLHTFQYITLRHGNLQVNIGINSGPVIAGVVGYHKPQFALIGDTVNTASRMSSTAPGPGSIQVSESTLALIGSKADLVINERTVNAKGKGLITVFLIRETEDSKSDLRARRNSLRMSSSIVLRHQTDDEARQLLFQLGYVRTSDVFKRRDTEVVESVKCVALFKRETPKQRTFRQGMIRKNYTVLMVGLCLLSLGFIWNGIMWTVEIVMSRKYSVSWSLAVSILFGPTLAGSFKPLAQNQWLQWILPLVCVAVCAFYSTSYDLSHVDHERLVQFLLSFTLVYFLAFGGLLVRHCLAAVVTVVAFWAVAEGRNEDMKTWTGTGLSLLPVACVSMAFTYYREQHLRTYANLEREAEKRITRTERLLTQMMPVHVYESLLQDVRVTDELRGVTLMYADIVGFTALSSHKSPSEMVTLLSTLFTKFDLLCVQNSVFKVHTIGDCYVAMGYTGARAGRDYEEECGNIVTLACDIVDLLQDFNRQHEGLGLSMRIGIHTGTEVITAGIIGSKVVRYDIYGPDVLVANKMESNGQAGRILISDVTKDIIEKISPGQYQFEERGRIDIPSVHRSHQSYFLSPLPSPLP